MITIELTGPCRKVTEEEAAIWYEGTAPEIGTAYHIKGDIKPPIGLMDCYVYKWDYGTKEWKHEKTLTQLAIRDYDFTFDVYSYFLGAYGLEGWWAFLITTRIRGEQSKWAILHVVRG